jgi:hypothetical protein
VQDNLGSVLHAANGSRAFITIHPSAPLRFQDEEEKRLSYAGFLSDLRSIEQLIDSSTDEVRSGVRAAK